MSRMRSSPSSVVATNVNASARITIRLKRPFAIVDPVKIVFSGSRHSSDATMCMSAVVTKPIVVATASP